MDGSRFVVITTINSPSEAIRKFASRPGWRLVVVGDKKTPADWSYPDAHFISPAEQARVGGRLASLLPWNHYCRKLLGYLHCIRAGAETIFDTDDDNIPNDSWAVERFDGTFDTIRDNAGFVNVYRLFTDQWIWPRGFPLEQLLREREQGPWHTVPADVRVGVWQALADGDPDVDAIYRLTSNVPCVFRQRAPVVLGAGTICPFNSQVTAFRRELFPLLYLPAFVTFRFTDILRGLVAQPIMWAAGYKLGFSTATVVQERNPHNYLRDFESELPCYLHAAAVVEVVSKAVKPSASVTENLSAAYEALHDKKVVTREELNLVGAWVADLQSLSPDPQGI